MTRSRLLRVLTVQPALRWLQPMPNMHLLRQTLEKQLSGAQVDLIVLPEVFNGVPADADASAGRTARQFLQTLARALKAAVVGGSIDFLHDDGHRRNSCFVLDAAGNEIGVYHTRVLYAGEQDTTTAGKQCGIFEVAGVRCGVLICADLWHPNLARELAGRVDLLCVPAKTTVPSENHVGYARELWRNLALTRAMENGLPIIVSDWAATRHEAVSLADGTQIRTVHYTSGAASITDPAKRPDFDALQQTLPADQPGILSAVIDLDAIAAYRDHRYNVGLLDKIADNTSKSSDNQSRPDTTVG